MKALEAWFRERAEETDRRLNWLEEEFRRVLEPVQYPELNPRGVRLTAGRLIVCSGVTALAAAASFLCGFWSAS